MVFNVLRVFSSPRIIAIIGDVNEAKSNLLYYFIDELRKKGSFNLYTYGLRSIIKDSKKIFSVDELEQIKDSVIILDELMSLWDLDNRMAKKQIEKTLRLIHHHNNILVICALPENLRKFICGKINQYFFKKCTLADFIFGSKASRTARAYKGIELGSSVLSIGKGEALFFDGLHYEKIKVPYLKKYDSKIKNIKIVSKIVNKIVNKIVKKNINKSVLKKVETKTEYIQ